MLVWIVLILLSVVAFPIIWLKYQYSYWSRRGIPHRKPLFLRGNVEDTHLSLILKDFYKKYKGTGPFAGFYFFTAVSAFIVDIDLVKNILIKDFNNFEDRGLFHNEVDDPLTGHLFSLDGEKWRHLRHKLSPTFTSGKMRYMFSTVVKVGKELEAVMCEKLEKSETKVLEVVDVMGRYTADVIGACAFGIECNSLRNPQADFVVMGKRSFTDHRHHLFIEGLMHTFPKMSRRLRMRLIHQDIHNFYMDIVKKTVEYRELSGAKHNDFMDILLELKNSPDSDGLTVEEIAAQAFVFFLAGFETSSTTMGFALYELAQQQDIQDKVREEIITTLKQHNDELSYECMKEMVYLNQIISETLRMHPVLPHLVRKAATRYETTDPEYYIEPGMSVIIPVIAIHHDPEFYPEPEKFIPERFTPEEIKKRPACTYLPFGEGPRNCIGLRFGKMQTLIGLALLLKNFKFTVAPETQVPYKLVKENFLLNSENGIFLKVEAV